MNGDIHLSPTLPWGWKLRSSHLKAKSSLPLHDKMKQTIYHHHWQSTMQTPMQLLKKYHSSYCSKMSRTLYNSSALLTGQRMVSLSSKETCQLLSLTINKLSNFDSIPGEPFSPYHNKLLVHNILTHSNTIPSRPNISDWTIEILSSPWQESKPITIVIYNYKTLIQFEGSHICCIKTCVWCK